MTAATRSDSMKTVLRPWTSCGSLALLLAVVAAIFCSGTMRAQQNVPSNGGVGARGTSRTPQPDLDPTMTAPMNTSVFQERRIRQLNLAQHKAMVSDADKLLKLVTELNTQLSSANPEALTADQLRMVAEIEKLAHSVKDKMRTTTQGSQDFMQAAPPAAVAPPRR